MPQWRKLWTKTTESLDVNDMPDDFHRLLWMFLPLITCREGRGMDNPVWIKAKAMPLRSDVTPTNVAKAMDWYAQHGMLQRYEVDGRRFFAIRNWHRYQGVTTREAPSNYPEPPAEELVTNSGPTQEQVSSSANHHASASVSDSESSLSSGEGESVREGEDSLDEKAYALVLDVWAKRFPSKPQPRANNRTLARKTLTRMEDAYFREHWEQALTRAARSKFLQGSSWFDLGWFVHNEDNWEKCYSGKYDDPSHLPKKGRSVGLAAFDELERLMAEQDQVIDVEVSDGST